MSQTEQVSTGIPTTDRVAQFKADVAEMRVADPRAQRDRTLAIVGVVLMLAGVVVCILAYFMSTDANFAFNSSGPAEQRDAIILAITGASVTVVGAVLFLRYSLAQFLRFWLARLIYEQQAQTDRVVDATTPRG